MQSILLLLALLFSLLLLASSTPLRASTAHHLRARLAPAPILVDDTDDRVPFQVASILPPPLHPELSNPTLLRPASITPGNPIAYTQAVEDSDGLLLTPASVLPGPPSHVAPSSSPIIGEGYLKPSDVLSMALEAKQSPPSDADAKRSRVRLYKLKRWLSEQKDSAPEVVYSH